MGLSSSLIIGRSALAASQAAIQVTGNNIANAATPGFSRQRVEIAGMRSERQSFGFAGGGVQIQQITRAIDPALNARLRDSVSSENAAFTELNILAGVESLTAEGTGIDLSTGLSRFFNAWSELANNPTSSVTQAAVAEEGESLASFIRQVRTDLLNQRDALDQQLGFNVERANTLSNEIASLNVAITQAELGTSDNGALRDQRDNLVDELSTLMDIQVFEIESGAVNILVDSLPLVLEGTPQGLKLDVRSVPANPATGDEGGVEVRVLTDEETPQELRPSEGVIGSLLTQRDVAIQRTLDDLDTLTSNLIFEVNRVHAVGVSSTPMSSVQSSMIVPPLDLTVPINDPANSTFSELPFNAANGSFTVVVTDENGSQTKQTIFLDLDGVDSTTGLPGTSTDTTYDDVRASINGVANVTATINAEGRLIIEADPNYTFHFEDDTSGVLATFGINTYFTGTDGADIGVHDDIRANPTRITTGAELGQNQNAAAIAGLRDKSIAGLGNVTLQESWLSSIEKTAVQTRAAQTRFDSLQTVRESLQAQDQAISGVSMDEESINLIQYQQQYSGAARYISVVDELTDILLSLV